MAAVQQGLAVIFALFMVGLSKASLSCKDINGNDVDWYYVYKLPKVQDNKNPLIASGLGHYYLDEMSQNFVLSTVSLNKTSHAVAQTVQQIYSLRDQIAYIMYNDQWPNGKKSEIRGHTKGVLAFDSEAGFWLIHSVPMFPSNVSYFWPDNALSYGQSMLCVSFKSLLMEDIAGQLIYTYPYTYDYRIPSELSQLAPSLQKVVDGQHVKTSPWSRKIDLWSLKGQQFVHYAKAAGFGQDLYAELLAPDMKANLKTETWQNGRNKLPSHCSGAYEVVNIKTIRFPEVTFNSTKDHSKVAMTDSSLNVVCVGDINRMKAQFRRGGGTMCLASSVIWDQYQQLVSCVEPCSGKPGC